MSDEQNKRISLVLNLEEGVITSREIIHCHPPLKREADLELENLPHCEEYSIHLNTADP